MDLLLQENQNIQRTWKKLENTKIIGGTNEGPDFKLVWSHQGNDFVSLAAICQLRAIVFVGRNWICCVARLHAGWATFSIACFFVLALLV